MKPEYCVSFLLSINIVVWQRVLYFPNDPLIKISVVNDVLFNILFRCHELFRLAMAWTVRRSIPGGGGVGKI